MKTNKQTNKQNFCNASITKIFGEKRNSKGKEGVPKFLIGAFEPELGGAKINISKEERAGDSACCGAGDLDVGAEESFQGTEGHCAWNAKASAALRREMPGAAGARREPRVELRGGERDWERETGSERTPCPPPLPQTAGTTRERPRDRAIKTKVKGKSSQLQEIN